MDSKTARVAASEMLLRPELIGSMESLLQATMKIVMDEAKKNVEKSMSRAAITVLDSDGKSTHAELLPGIIDAAKEAVGKEDALAKQIDAYTETAKSKMVDCKEAKKLAKKMASIDKINKQIAEDITKAKGKTKSKLEQKLKDSKETLAEVASDLVDTKFECDKLPVIKMEHKGTLREMMQLKRSLTNQIREAVAAERAKTGKAKLSATSIAKQASIVAKPDKRGDTLWSKLTKSYAKEHGITYAQAMRNEEHRKRYHEIRQSIADGRQPIIDSAEAKA